MFKPNDRLWGFFKIEAYFEVSGTETTHPSMLIPNGKTPRVTCAAVNNGLEDTYQNKPTEKGDVITVDSATFGYISYQGADFIATDHVEKITRCGGNHLGLYTGLFVKMCIEKATEGNYNYGYKFSQSRIRRQYIALPLDSNGYPDWQFMEDYMRQVEQALLKPVVEKLKERIGGEPLQTTIGGAKWNAFAINEIFNIKATRSSIDKKNLTNLKGNIPYITRTDINNGIDSLIGTQTSYKKDEGNVITIGLDTQTVFYQPTSFYTGQNIQVIRHNQLNRLNALFLNVTFKSLLEKFNWGGNGATLSRLKRSKIMLPINIEGEPDLEYMENYMRQVERKLLLPTINSLEMRLKK